MVGQRGEWPEYGKLRYRLAVWREGGAGRPTVDSYAAFEQIAFIT